MKAYEAETVIQADPQKVWQVLTEVEAWPSWDSGVLKVQGKVREGERVKLVSETNPKRAFSLKVSSFDPPSSLYGRWHALRPLPRAFAVSISNQKEQLRGFG